MRLASRGRMTHINSFKDLVVWQASMDLVDVCFDIVEAIHHPYRFVLADQLLPSGISIPSHIAEGSRRPTKAYRNHLSISLGSHAEVEPVGKMLHGLVASLELRDQHDQGWHA
jgi:four helix bundle protein